MRIVPRVIQRSTNLVDIQVPRRAGVSKYRLKGAKTLDDAFTAPTIFIEDIQSGTFYASDGIRKKNLHHVDTNLGNNTRIKFDINEFAAPANNLPLDDHQLYFVVDEYIDSAGAYTSGNNVIILPPAVSYSVRFLTATCTGDVPQVATALAGSPPPTGSLWITLPGQAVVFRIENLSATDSMFIAYDEGTPLVEIKPEKVVEVFELRTKQFAVVSTAAGVTFNLVSTVNAD